MAMTQGFRIEGADVPAIAAAALTKGTVMTLTTDSSGGDRRVTTCGTSDIPFGVVLDDAASGESCAVRIAGIALVSANGAFSLGDELCVAASDGEVDTIAADGWSVGQALHAAANAQELVPCRLFIHYHNIP